MNDENFRRAVITDACEEKITTGIKMRVSDINLNFKVIRTFKIGTLAAKLSGEAARVCVRENRRERGESEVPFCAVGEKLRTLPSNRTFAHLLTEIFLYLGAVGVTTSCV